MDQAERIEELELVICVLWDEMDVLTVNVLKDEHPDVVALCQRLHRAYGH